LKAGQAGQALYRVASYIGPFAGTGGKKKKNLDLIPPCEGGGVIWLEVCNSNCWGGGGTKVRFKAVGNGGGIYECTQTGWSHSEMKSKLKTCAIGGSQTTLLTPPAVR